MYEIMKIDFCTCCPRLNEKQQFENALQTAGAWCLSRLIQCVPFLKRNTKDILKYIARADVNKIFYM